MLPLGSLRGQVVARVGVVGPKRASYTNDKTGNQVWCPRNPVLERNIVHLLKRPVGRPSKKPKVFYHAFRYQAKSWDRARRVVAKVEWHAGELFPRGRLRGDQS